MQKKRVFVVSLILIVFLSIGFASAFSWNDFFNGLTGRATSNSSSGGGGGGGSVNANSCFQLGSSGSFVSGSSGDLYLYFNDQVQNFGDNIGSFNVNINGASLTLSPSTASGQKMIHVDAGQSVSYSISGTSSINIIFNCPGTKPGTSTGPSVQDILYGLDCNGNITSSYYKPNVSSSDFVCPSLSPYTVVGKIISSNPTNQTIKCNSNSDCGNSSSFGPYCSGNSVCYNSTSYTCSNPGTSQSACISGGSGGCSSPCPNGCSNGLCNPSNSTNQTNSCTDSDGGINYNVYGNLTVKNSDNTFTTESDFCLNGNDLSEQYCQGSIPSNTIYTCPNGCSNGACINSNLTSNDTCTDSDGGVNPNVKGVISGTYSGVSFNNEDSCQSNNMVAEEYCGWSEHPSPSIVYLNCSNGCSNGACIQGTNSTSTCQEVANNNGLLFNELDGYTLISNFNDSYYDYYSGLGNVSTSYLQYQNGNQTMVVQVLVADAVIKNTLWWSQAMSSIKQNAWSGGTIYTGDKSSNSNQYYSIYSQFDTAYFWVNGNTIIVLNKYNNQPVYSYNNGQFTADQLLSKIQDNRFDYVQSYIPNDVYDFAYQYMNKCSSQVSESCFPDWQKKVEPVICPEYGSQQQTLVDISQCAEDIKTTLYCSPGLCSGCYVPRYNSISSKDNICVPYGFRIPFAQGQSFRLYNTAELTNNLAQIGITAVMSPDSTIYLTLNQSFPFPIQINGQSYGNPGDSFTINSYYTYDIAFTENGVPVHYQIEVKQIHYSDVLSEQYIQAAYSKNFNGYCDIDGKVKQQKTVDYSGNWASCQNNYECSSNLCSDGECVNVKAIAQQANSLKGLIVKVLCRLANVFSGDGYDQCVTQYS